MFCLYEYNFRCLNRSLLMIPNTVSLKDIILPKCSQDVRATDQSGIPHNEPVPYPKIHRSEQKYRNMPISVLNGVLWDMGQYVVELVKLVYSDVELHVFSRICFQNPHGMLSLAPLNSLCNITGCYIYQNNCYNSPHGWPMECFVRII